MTTMTIAAILTLAFLSTFGKSQDSVKQKLVYTFDEFSSRPSVHQKSENNASLAIAKEFDIPQAVEIRISHETFRIEDESEETMKIESWMIFNNFFGQTDDLQSDNQDKPLKMESWMINENIWK